MNANHPSRFVFILGITLSCIPPSSFAQNKTEMVLDMIRNAQVVALADSFYVDGQYSRALEKYDEFLTKHPRNGRALFNRAHCLQSLGELAQARTAYTSILDIDSTHVLAWINRSSVYLTLQQYDKALADARRATLLDPGSALAHYNWGVASVGLNDFNDALKRFTDAIRSDPSDAKAYFNRGVIRSSQGNRKDACQDWKQSLALGYTAADDLLREHCK